MTPVPSRTAVELLLRRIRGGALVIDDADGTQRQYGAGPPTIRVKIHSPTVWRMLLRGSVGLADAHSQGLWDCDDLVGLVRLAARNAEHLDELRRRVAPLLVIGQRVRALGRPASGRRRRRDIAAHYDLGNELFSRMLDPTMTYSCGVFEDPRSSLEEAQSAKLELVCRKLELQPGDRVLEIGTGWGSFALHAAGHHGCHVTTTTLSAEQYAHTRGLVRRAGLEDRITVLSRDYRELQGRFDKLVSIEMIEAVGWRHTGTFLGACSRLLAPAGAMLLQAITIDDRAYDVEKASRSFMNQRIFPGGSLPSVRSLGHDLARHTDLKLVHLQDLTGHYVTTLARWRQRFVAHARELAGLGYDEPFQRMWALYLAYCQAGFAERRIGDVQLVLAKPGCRLSWLLDGGEGSRLARAYEPEAAA